MNHRLSPPKHRGGGILAAVLLCLVVIGIVGGGAYWYYSRQTGVSSDELITQVALRAPFDHIVLEQGEIESSSNQEVICEVKSRGSSMGGVAILWVIEEGTRVKKGDKLVELDQSQLELNLKDQKIQVLTAEALVTSAEAALEQAKIARQEYLEGVFKTEEKALLSELALAEQALRKAELAIQSSERLVAKGLVKSLQLEADRFAVANAQNQKEAAEGKLDVLRNLTKSKMLVQYDSDIEAASATLSAQQSELAEKQAELDEIESQITKCTMYAPGDGVVVHANRYSSRGGSAEFVVEAGATVRERQEIIRLPDPSLMQVKCKVNESMITLIREGMAARISVDAIPGMKLTGRVVKVNRYAEPSSFFSSSIKEYATLVEIIDPPDNIRTGMTAEVQIFVSQLDEALQIPIQGLYEHGDKMYSLIKRDQDQFATSEVKLQATNDKMAVIEEGLSEGDEVVLNVRSHLTLMDLPTLEREDNSEMRALAREGIAQAGASGDKGRSGPGGPGGEGGFGGPGGGRGGPGGGRGGPGGGGRGGPGGGGGFGGGGGRGGPGGGGGFSGGGGNFNPSMIVDRIFGESDTNGDGAITEDEMGGMQERRRDMVKQADADGDGKVTKAEILQGFQQRMSGGGQR